MKTSLPSACVIATCVILTSADCVLAQDWPQWRGPHRDGKVTGFKAPRTWPKELAQKWKAQVGLGDATPALVGDRLYVFARQDMDEVTVCLDAGNAKELWRDQYAAQSVSGADGSHSGPRSSPAVADGKIVTLGVGGILSCLDAATGKVVWRKDEFPKVTPRFHTAMSPIIVDGLAIAHLGGQGNGAIIAFDLATGNQKWKWADEAPAYASPTLMTAGGTKQLVTLSEKSVLGIGTADGRLLWRIPFAPQGMTYNAATAIVEGQTVIFMGQGRGTKAVKIEKAGDAFEVKELWSNAELAPQFNSPVLKNGLLFGLSGRGNFFCLNAQTGQTAWSDAAQQDNKGFGSILDAGPVLLALAPKSELIAFEPSDKQYAEVARIKVADTPIYAYPVIAGNRIFVKDKDAVTLWTLE